MTANVGLVLYLFLKLVRMPTAIFCRYICFLGQDKVLKIVIPTRDEFWNTVKKSIVKNLHK